MARGKAIASLLALTAVQQCAAEASRVATSTHPYCPVFYTEPPTECDPIPDTFLPFSTDNEEFPPPYIEVLEDTFNALAVLQRDYFDPDYGTWPSAIDWTAAVVGTVVSGTLTTLSRSLGSVDLGEFDNWKAKENLISSFYAQVVSAYFGQDVLSIRGQVSKPILLV